MTTTPKPAEPNAEPSFGLSVLHLAAFSGFAIAQPLFDLLRQDATFFLARRAQPIDISVTAVGLAIGPPLVAAIVLLLASLGGRSARMFVARALIGVLATLAIAPVLLRQLEADRPWVLGVALALGTLVELAYERFAPVRTFASVLAPAPLVFAALFWFDARIAKVRATAGGSEGLVELAGVEVEGDPAVVLVVFDELPMTSLVTPDLEIDSKLYPNFARLAAESTWFRNATASHEHTETAVPTILSGVEPAPPAEPRLPLASDYPNSLFSLLGGSFRMRVHETFTAVCPPELAGVANAPVEPTLERWSALANDLTVVYGHTVLPTAWSKDLPSITAAWGDFGGAQEEAAGGSDLDAKQAAGRSGRAELMREFIASIDGADEPSLYFLHVLLPHGDWIHTSSGASYDPAGLPLGWEGARWTEDEPVVRLGLQRHLLQLGFVDTLVGELIDRMQDVGIWERSLVVVVADHGISFGPGEYPRQTYKKNARKIAHVPFFVKRPGQVSGSISDRNVETVDVVPTIADVLGLDVTWETYGSSVFGSVERDVKKIYRKERRPLNLDVPLPTTWAALDRRVAIFGAAPTRAELFALAGGAEWLGRTTTGVEREARWLVKLGEPERWKRVELDARPLPLTVSGTVGSTRGPLPERLAIAVNGVIRATAPIHGRVAGVANFACLLPEESFAAGPNVVEVFGLDELGLVRIPDARFPR